MEVLIPRVDWYYRATIAHRNLIADGELICHRNVNPILYIRVYEALLSYWEVFMYVLAMDILYNKFLVFFKKRLS